MKLILKRFFSMNSYISTGGVLVAVSVIAAVLAPIISPCDPVAIQAVNRLLPPSSLHMMGTDELGRDILSRLLYGTQTSIVIGMSVVIISTILGIAVGTLSGFYRKLDSLLMRILDGIMAFPSIIIAITMAGILGPGKLNIVFALSFAYFPLMARIVRSSVLTVRDIEYVESAHAVGANNFYIITKYILPNIISPIIVQATFIFALSVLDEAALSFLGVGIKAPTPSLGGMISDGRKFMSVAPWIVISPGAAIAWIVLGLNLLGDGLRDFFDPRLDS